MKKRFLLFVLLLFVLLLSACAPSPVATPAVVSPTPAEEIVTLTSIPTRAAPTPFRLPHESIPTATFPAPPPTPTVQVYTTRVSAVDGMTQVFVPAGTLHMGGMDVYAENDEVPYHDVSLKGFWLDQTEVTNAQYALFDPRHDTRYIDMHYMDRVTPGHIANHPDQPVARVSWREAVQFCKWLSAKTGLHATLPTEAQWEWAARAGTAQADGMIAALQMAMRSAGRGSGAGVQRIGISSPAGVVA